jgi:acyl carrier protein
MSQTQAIKETVKEYLLDNFLGTENSGELTDETPLVSGGILDSITTLQLVAFLEEKYKVEFEPNELEQDNLNTISRIAGFVESKMKTAQT